MTNSQSNICVVLPYPPAYSETFLTTHVEKLPATVCYLKHFPLDTDDPHINGAFSDKTEILKQRFKASLHGCVLNPAKRVYLRNFFRTHKIKIVLAEYGSAGVGALGMCRELRIPLVVHFHGADAYSTENLDRHKESYKKMFVYSS